MERMYSFFCSRLLRWNSRLRSLVVACRTMKCQGEAWGNDREGGRQGRYLCIALGRR